MLYFLRSLTLLIALTGLLAGTQVAQGTIRYVKVGGTQPPVTATSWNTATADLQGAINASSPGDQVWVAQGTYKPTTITDRAASFTLANGVALYGGFLGIAAETSVGSRPSLNPVTGQPSNTTLSGDIDNDGMLANNSYHVVYSGSGVTAILDGFVIAGGNATFSNTFTDKQNFGGGMLNEGSSPTITNCVFTSCTADYGAGMCNTSSTPTVSNCVFQSNSATSGGGGSYNEQDSYPTLIQCLMVNNQSGSGSGGGFSSNRSHPVLTSCTAVNNTAGYGGGGVDIYGNSFRVENCLIANNQALDGGGINTSNNIGQASIIPPVLTSCTIVGNTGFRRGGGIFFGLGVSPSLTDCFLTSNTATSGGSGGGGYDGSGGGGFAFQSSPNLTNCILRNNTASGYGGGLYYETIRSSYLTNCTFDGNITMKDGGGAYMYQSVPTLSACTFTKNKSGQNGGGLSGGRSNTATLTNCVFQSNSAVSNGGGIYDKDENGGFFRPHTTLQSCTFMSNQAAIGGAISSLTSVATLTNCKLHNNSSTLGGGIYADKGTITAANTSFQGNSAASGGGIVALTSSTIVLTNTSFQGNSGAPGGAILTTSSDNTIELTNCVLFGNGPANMALSVTPDITANYCFFQTGMADYTGTNNLTGSGNPFASTTDTPLASGSPAIDTGLDTALGLTGVTTDLAGKPRFVGLNCRVDMGAYEFQQPNNFGSLILVAGNGTLSCASPTLSLTAIGGKIYSFTGPGVVSQFNGSERVIVGNYLITRTPLPATGTAVVNQPGVYTVVVGGDNGCAVQTTITVPGVACPNAEPSLLR